MDEFAWILMGALVFILIITMIWLPSREPSPLVEPKSVDRILTQGSSTSFFLSINGTSTGKLSNVTLTPLGGISNWISFDKNNFDIENSDQVGVTVIIPTNVMSGTYTGSITVSSAGGKVSVPVTITVANIAQLELKSRPIFLGDINVRYFVGPEILAAKENFEVTKSYFKESKETLVVSIPSEKLQLITDGYFSFSVQSTNKEGNLIVIFNGYEIFNRKVDAGNITIPIDRSLINNTNTIVLQATSPPLYKFWSTTIYNIKELNFVANYQDISKRERLFDLSDREMANFKYFRLTGTVGEGSKPSELMIKINNQLVYSKIPPLALLNETFEKTIIGDAIYLKAANNTISFSFEKEATYKIDDAFLIVYYY
jgi:hypothetical protein